MMVWPIGYENRDGIRFKLWEGDRRTEPEGQSPIFCEFSDGIYEPAVVLITRVLHKSFDWRCGCGARGRTAIVPYEGPDPRLPKRCPRRGCRAEPVQP